MITWQQVDRFRSFLKDEFFRNPIKLYVEMQYFI